MIEVRYRLKMLCEYEDAIRKVLKIYGLSEETKKNLEKFLAVIEKSKKHLVDNKGGILC